jgi:hypothetical protein
LRFVSWSYRYAEQILNSKLTLKKEIEEALAEIEIPPKGLRRPELNALIEKKFIARGWSRQPKVIGDSEDVEMEAKLDFIKERVGVEVAFSHASFIGIDLLKFQTMSYSALDQIDVGVYVLATSVFLRRMIQLGQKWEGSLTFEKVKRYLPNFKSAIQVPIFVLGLDY